MLNAHGTCRKATLYFSPAIVAKVESLVMDIVMDVLIRFRVITQRSKDAHCFHGVVGLVVINIRQWSTHLGKSSESVQRAITGHVCACVTGLQRSALYQFGRFALICSETVICGSFTNI